MATTTKNIDQEKIDQAILAEAAKRMMNFVKRLFPQATLDDKTNINGIQSIEELSRFIPYPILSGEPRVDIDSDKATIHWMTDIDATSQIAISSDDDYNRRTGDRYIQVVGDAQTLSKEHSVLVIGLKSDSIYHYQLRSKGGIGPLAVSRDFTFRTTREGIRIISFLTQIKDAQTVSIKWVTNKEANSAIQFVPYFDNVAALDKVKLVKKNEFELIHEIEIKEFEPGIFYDIEIISTDKNGVAVMQKINHFSTEQNDLPPEITNIKTDSTVFLDKNNKTQTVISWQTNEPANAQIFYQEGVHGSGDELSEKTEVNNNFTKEHIFIITNFKPGVVYSFQVKVVDSGGNEALSKIHTFMTAKNKESIIQIIIKILEDTFGWVKKLM